LHPSQSSEVHFKSGEVHFENLSEG
jgi:hypothetical protein